MSEYRLNQINKTSTIHQQEYNMIKGNETGWQRIEFDNTPIYIRPDGPDWFVPNPAADDALKKLLNGGGTSEKNGIRHLMNRINGSIETNYQSRADQLQIDSLKECWLHITNRCNMNCGHCMFQSSSRAKDELTEDDCKNIIDDAYALGCRIFYFTGGEPLLSTAFYKSLHDIFGRPETHGVVLTNLSLISNTNAQFTDFPRERLHFQVSIDGLQANHDALRGTNAFEQLSENLEILGKLGFPVALAMTVTSKNVHEMESVIDFAGQRQLSNVHFLWLFQKGNAGTTLFVKPDTIFSHLKKAQYRAEQLGVTIDNIEILRSQVFSCPETRYDLSNAGWQSIAVGPDGYVYPTPALVYTEKMACGHIREGIKQVWQHSDILKNVRSASLNSSEAYRANVLRYLVGGGDIDHSYIHCKEITGCDPYVELYNRIAKWLIVREAANERTNRYPAFKLKMGEKLGDCPVEGGSIFFTHSNCVLSLPGHDNRTLVNQFYSAAAEDIQEDILNPICYDNQWIEHIPEAMRYRSYGCGSPVLEADIQPGETVLDLGSGTGIECFIAGKMVGPEGKVIGIDMGDTMLSVANKTKKQVVENLGYDNIEFQKSFLETLSLDVNSVDLVISNCVLNLSPDKRGVFSEIYRVLKPGGRLIISDITYNETIPLAIKYNEKLRGECIGGALPYQDLFGLLNDIGFSNSRIVKGYHYRDVQGYHFYSITYQAVKPGKGELPVLYDFPDFDTTLAAVESEPACACFQAPAQEIESPLKNKDSQKIGCMECGAELEYFDVHKEKTCIYCGQTQSANAQCVNGHFVCDSCHQTDAVDIIKHICLQSRETDATNLMQTIRSHPHFRMHGPEHHSMVPAVILTAMRNSGYFISDEQIITGIERGQTIAGGACAFLGICGAAAGVGIAISVLTEATPYDGDKRQAVQRMTQQVLGEIAAYNAPRCCQRDCWIALQEASKLLKEEFSKTMTAGPIVCDQFKENKECIHHRCPLWPRGQKR